MPYKNTEYRKWYDRERNRLRKWNMPRTEQVRRRYLSAREHRMIMGAVLAGESMASTARSFGISYSTVKDMVYGKSKPREIA
jgi:hypothetical protein